MSSPEKPDSVEPYAMPMPDAVRYSGCSRSELYRRLSSGEIQAIKNGRSTLILTSSLRAYLESLPPATFRPAQTA